MDKPTVTVVIPCYNDLKYVAQTIQSAYNQTYLHKEIIVIDDGSNEKTKDLLETQRPYLDHLLHQENCGQSRARNKGVQLAKGEYVLVLDSDDFFEKTFLEKAVAILQQNKEIAMITCHSCIISEDSNSKKSIFIPKGGSLSNFLFNNAAMGSVLFRKNDCKLAGGYDETMRNGWEDWEFYIRLLKNGGQCYVIPETLFNYRKRRQSTTTVANAYKYDLWKYIFTKHEDIYQANYNELIDFFLGRLQREEFEKKKKISSIDYRWGKKILQPLRLFKRLFIS